MAKPQPVADIVEEMFQSILATPKRQRRLRSKTFWEGFGFKMRTKERVEQVRVCLKQRGLIINLDDEQFGTEDKDEWIVLTFVEPPRPPAVIQETLPTVDVPMPPGDWFALLAGRMFESEREVEYYFIVPLLEQLGYVEADFAIGFPVQMYEGVKKVNKEADFVLFNGESRARDDALLVVEAKKIERIVTEDAVGQARAYAMWLTTPYYLVTNGEDIRVYLFRGAVQPDVLLMNFRRVDLQAQWPTLYQTLNKEAVIEYKEKVRKVLDSAGAS
jgi:type I restriction and modification enzyme subunit R-like protein